MLTAITAALASLEPQGDFAAKQVTIVDDLNIEIKDVGKLVFPLQASKVHSLIQHARPAKYGLKDQTLLDRDVRDVWEIPKSAVKIDKRVWNKTLNPTLAQLKTQLGLPESGKLKAELHNLLIYENGQFFQPHQDSEKGQGMVATLVVVLPSFYRGGSLNVSLQGQKKNYPSTSTPQDKLTFIAFYADCYHQVRPVTAGYRVVLTYNLIFDHAAHETVLVPSTDTQFAALANAVSGYFSQPIEAINGDHRQGNRKLVYLLDHEYTEKGLSWESLKNDDRARAQLLREVAVELDLEIYLGLVALHEMWSCDDNGGYSRYHRYRDDRVEYECVELIEDDASIVHWIDANDQQAPLSELLLSNQDICWTIATDEFDPFESDYEGYMGNWGNTEDRWYHRTAVIAWPRHEHYAVMLEFSPSCVVKELLALANKKSSLPQAEAIIQNILPYWSGLEEGAPRQSLTQVLKVALRLSHPEIAHQLCAPLGMIAFTGQTVKTLLQLARLYGDQWWIDLMQKWVTPDRYERCVGQIKDLPNILKMIVATAPKDHDALSDWLILYQYTALKKAHAEMLDTHSQPKMQQLAGSLCQAMGDILLLCRLADKQPLHDEVMGYIVQSQPIYPALDLAELVLNIASEYVGVAFRAWEWSTLVNLLFKQISLELEQGFRQADDWSILDENNCGCDDCVVLQGFLQSSDLQVKCWPLAKGRRQHIHNIIERLILPVTHETERVGSPHKLILKKTDVLFTQAKARCIRCERALSGLARIKAE